MWQLSIAELCIVRPNAIKQGDEFFCNCPLKLFGDLFSVLPASYGDGLDSDSDALGALPLIASDQPRDVNHGYPL